MQKHDVNGWDILKKHLKSTPEHEKVFDAIFGSDFDRELLARGGHLLTANHAAKLAEGLGMNSRNMEEFYNRIITARCNAGCNHNLEEFKECFCEHAARNTGSVPCAKIDILWHFQPLHETLHGFMKRVAIASFSVNCPPGCCAFRVTRCRMTAQLDIPENSLIIVNGTKPAHPDELALLQCRNQRLILGKLSEADINPDRIKWTAPVVQLRYSNLS